MEMDTKERLKLWNKQKWESKNRAMYETYAENKWPWFNAELDPDIEEYIAAAAFESADILDLGTCSGSQGIELAKRGHRVVGTDISETALSKANAAIAAMAGQEQLPIEFLLDDITETTLGESRFDLILDRGCYHSICTFQHHEFVAGVRKVLKPGGILLLKTMSSDEKRFIAYDQVGPNKIQMPYHFTREKLEGVLAPDFEILEIRDSFFYSDVVDPPAKARFAIVRNNK